jgi:hypothetical protein
MKLPTLGYEEDSLIGKREIATLQLGQAIVLFLVQNFVCAVTLAGASEAVFAGLLEAEGEKSVVEDSTAVIQKIREYTGLAVAEGKKKKELYNEWNSARNKLKHHSNNDEELVSLNLCDEAYWMIRRALVNAEKLSAKIDNQADFENWIIVNINL